MTSNDAKNLGCRLGIFASAPIPWSLVEQCVIKTEDLLPQGQEMYNLFDGIISFTQNDTTDKWIKENFRF